MIAETDLAIEGLTNTQAGALTNTSGTIMAVSGDLTLNVASLTNEQPEPTVESTTTTEKDTDTTPDRTVTTTTVTTTESLTEDNAPAQLISGGDLTITTGALINSYSRIAAQGALSITAASLTNTGRKLTESVTTTVVTQPTDDTLETTTDTASSTRILDVVGTIEAVGTISDTEFHDTALTVDLTGDLTNSGTISSYTGADFTVGGDLTSSGTLIAEGELTLEGPADGHLGALTLEEGSLTNGEGGLAIKAASLTNAGLLYSGTSSDYQLDGSFTNTEADIIAETDLTIDGLTGQRARALTNSSGLIEAVAGDLTVRAASVTNQRARFEVEMTPVAEDPRTTSEVVACRTTPGWLWHCGGIHGHDREKTTQTTTTTVVTETDRIVADSRCWPGTTW